MSALRRLTDLLNAETRDEVQSAFSAASRSAVSWRDFNDERWALKFLQEVGDQAETADCLVWALNKSVILQRESERSIILRSIMWVQATSSCTVILQEPNASCTVARRPPPPAETEPIGSKLQLL